MAAPPALAVSVGLVPPSAQCFYPHPDIGQPRKTRPQAQSGFQTGVFCALFVRSQLKILMVLEVLLLGLESTAFWHHPEALQLWCPHIAEKKLPVSYLKMISKLPV